MRTIEVDALKQLSTEDIYNSFLPQIEKMLERYDDIPLPKEMYEEVIYNSIEETLSETKATKFDLFYLLPKLERDLQSYLRTFGLVKSDATTSHKSVDTITKFSKKFTWSKEEEKEILLQAKTGDHEAMEKLVRKYHNLFLFMANKMRKMISTASFDEYDFYQEGVLVLYKAVRYFDVDQDVQFYTYLSRAIYRHLSALITKQIQLHKKNFSKLISFQEACETMENSFEKISIEKIADRIGVSYGKAQYYYNTMYASSLDDAIDEVGTTFGDLIEDGDATPIEKQVMNVELKEEMKTALLQVTSTQKRALLWHYGFIDGIPYGFEELGKKFKVRRQAVKDAETKGLQKLRDCSSSETLRKYL